MITLEASLTLPSSSRAGAKMVLPDIPTLVSKEELRTKLFEVGGRIANEYEGKPILLISVLTGAIRFTSRLMSRLHKHRLMVEPVTVRSYRGTESTLAQPYTQGLTRELVKGKHVLIVDDILDTGQTLGLLRDIIQPWDPASLKTAVMLHKVNCQLPKFGFSKPDFVGHEIGSDFVVGFGLDYNGLFRNLNRIGILSPALRDEVDAVLSSSAALPE